MTQDELSTLIELAPVAVGVFEGPDHRGVLANRRLVELFGDRQLLGRPLREAVPELAGEACVALLDSAFLHGERGSLVEQPTQLPDASGAAVERFCSITVEPIRDEGGRVTRTMLIAHDVSKTERSRRAAEDAHEQLRNALNAAEVGNWQIDLRSERYTRDARLNEILGLEGVETTQPAGDMIGRVHPEDRRRVEGELDRCLREGGRYLGDCRIVRPDGSVRWIHDRGQLVVDHQGQPAYMTGAVVDITERKELERQHEAARQLAIEANRAKDEFLAMLGHELRNPLAPIQTALQIMRLRGHRSREQEVIERQVGHLTRLVDDLLDVSRITRAKVELRRRPMELAMVVGRAVEMASPLLEQRRHHVDVRVPRRDLAVNVDLDRMSQVISNLLTNAAKYSDPGSLIGVAAERLPTTVRLSVTDEGVGIAPDMIANVFDLFFQMPQTLDRSRGGLGLGLTIVKSLVVLHGGTVAVRSEGLGKGSEFIIELPAVEIADYSSPTMADSPTPPPELAGALGKRVLVVDDNLDAAETLAIALEEMGHKVRVAHDGPSALTTARAFDPDVALVDIGLPVMDGYEVARRLRTLYGTARPRLIAVTGYGQEGDRQRSAAAGFHLHMVKPVDLGALKQVVLEGPRKAS